MTDLATLSLGHTPTNELSLTEKHKLYEDWRASSQRTLRTLGNQPPALARADDGKQPLTEKRALLVGHAMKAGVDIGEIDQTNLCKSAYEIADEVLRTDADKEVPRVITPELRTRLATAALNILENSMERADDDAEVKNKVVGQGNVKKGSSPGVADDDGPDDGKPRKADDDDTGPAWFSKAMDNVSKRLDALEGKGRKEDDDDDDGDDKGKHDDVGEPQELAADSARDSYRRNAAFLKKGQLGRITCDAVTVDEFAKVQARADRVYSAWGKSAPKPMHGEELNNYRRRLLKPYQHHSPTFKKADLRVVAVEDSMFDHVEEEIWKAAFDAVRDPSTVPLGVLREEVSVRNGHTTTKFHGRPLSWMAPFMQPGKRVRQIVERTDSGDRVRYQARKREIA